MSNALRVYIRGFDSQANGEKIVQALEQIGFDIKETVDGKSDDNGGLIETYITPFDNLSLAQGEVEINALEAEIKQLVPSAFVQFDEWNCIGGDHGRPGYDGRFGIFAYDDDDEEDDAPFGIVE